MLKRKMVQALQLQPQQTAKIAWEHYWYKQYRQQIQSSSPATPSPVTPSQHLLAYVQESCYWASYRFHQKMAQFVTVSYQTLADYFQIAQSQFPKVLAGFSPDRGANLETYAELAFTHRLKDAVRQQKALDVCSDWSLLRRTSRKRLQETFNQQSLSPSLQQRYLWAWLCFREGWVIGPGPGGTKRQVAPAPEDWQAIAQAYNQTQSPEQPRATPQQLEQWLAQTARWLRNYLYPPVQSLNQMQFGEEGEERLERVADPARSIPPGRIYGESFVVNEFDCSGGAERTTAAAIAALSSPRTGYSHP